MEEIVTNNTNVEQDYIDKLTELKNNSVSRDEYDRLRADNKKLLDAMFNGAAQVTEPEPKKPEVNIQALRDKLYGGRYDGTDLDYISSVLTLRKAIMEKGEADPGVCNGKKTVATEADYVNCQATCDALQDIVDYSEGDPAVFRAELMRRVKF